MPSPPKESISKVMITEPEPPAKKFKTANVEAPPTPTGDSTAAPSSAEAPVESNAAVGKFDLPPDFDDLSVRLPM
eukprot:7172728-Pyramimonas_sp.AAC.1